eukprot:scaffold650385_cov38-Prasinocladus_malaysianus.AAC.1
MLRGLTVSKGRCQQTGAGPAFLARVPCEQARRPRTRARGVLERYGSDGPSADASLALEAEALPTTETAIFGLGRPEATFASLEGVVATRVGYTGGDGKDPTYKT